MKCAGRKGKRAGDEAATNRLPFGRDHVARAVDDGDDAVRAVRGLGVIELAPDRFAQRLAERQHAVAMRRVRGGMHERRRADALQLDRTYAGRATAAQVGPRSFTAVAIGEERTRTTDEGVSGVVGLGCAACECVEQDALELGGDLERCEKAELSEVGPVQPDNARTAHATNAEGNECLGTKRRRFPDGKRAKEGREAAAKPPVQRAG